MKKMWSQTLQYLEEIVKKIYPEKKVGGWGEDLHPTTPLPLAMVEYR